MTAADESSSASPCLPPPPDHTAVFDAIPLSATLIDRQWIIRDVNQAFLETAWSIGRQIDKADRIGRSILEFAGDGDEGRQLAALIERLWTTGERQVLQLAYIGATGRREHMVIRAEAVRDPAGAITGALLLRERVTRQVEDRLGLERELAHRRQLEADLVRARDEWARTFAAIPDPIAILDREYRIVRVNQAMADRLGLAAEACVGMTCFTCVHGKTAPPSSCPHARLLADGQLHTGEVLEPRLGGWFLVTVAPLRDPEGRLTGSVHVARDITAVKTAEQALRESAAQYRELVEGLPVAFTRSTITGVLLYHNPHFREMLGYTAEQLSAMSTEDLYVRPADRQELLRQVATHGVHSYEYPLRRGDGRVIQVRGTTRAIVNEQGETELHGYSEDITERRQMEQELIGLERLRALGELSAGIIHNLNNLLTGILVPAQMLRVDSQDPVLTEALETIVVSARRAGDLVERLHRWARRQDDSKVGSVSLNAAVAEVVRTSRPRWKDEPEARGLVIHVEQRLGAVRPVRGTAAGMHDILLNLLLNAVAALPRGGTITIATRPAGEEMELVFADDGVGMDEETRLRVFEPFFTTRRDVGSGLGLATVYGLVQRWGGEIRVASAPGQGTTFTLRLLAADGEPPNPMTAESVPDTGLRRRLLVVEDEAVVARTMSMLLGRRHEVDVVRTAQEGLERVRTTDYDIALIDLGLPDRPGDQLALELRQLVPGLVLVLVTGWVLEEEDPRRAPFDHVLQKPFTDLTEFVETVARAEHRRGKRGR